VIKIVLKGWWLVLEIAAMKKLQMITPREFAKQIGRPYQTVLYWLRNSMVPGVETRQESSGVVYYVPQTAVTQFKDKGPKRGRPRKPLSELKSRPRRKD
jgi:hypothetical protein